MCEVIINQLNEKNKYLEERIEHLEFRLRLIADNTNVTRMLYEYDITQVEYSELMNLMDEFRSKLDKGDDINHATFERKVIEITNSRISYNPDRISIEYHFCEYLAQSFMEDGRWDEVFPALYADMPKYKYYMENRNKDK